MKSDKLAITICAVYRVYACAGDTFPCLRSLKIQTSLPALLPSPVCLPHLTHLSVTVLKDSAHTNIRLLCLSAAAYMSQLRSLELQDSCRAVPWAALLNQPTRPQASSQTATQSTPRPTTSQTTSQTATHTTTQTATQPTAIPSQTTAHTATQPTATTSNPPTDTPAQPAPIPTPIPAHTLTHVSTQRPLDTALVGLLLNNCPSIQHITAQDVSIDSQAYSQCVWRLRKLTLTGKEKSRVCAAQLARLPCSEGGVVEVVTQGHGLSLEVMSTQVCVRGSGRHKHITDARAIHQYSHPIDHGHVFTPSPAQ